ncbi:MAG: mannose-1-phosphate guanylyltransferase [Cyclobacteriaceae bacterium]|nr:mannose-1-phosphate guanylyltransferase [Cyclobacteriaceae bacterium]
MVEKENIYAVIMAGGIGSRFWPASRESTPKQFLDMMGTGKSLLQVTVDRLSNICPVENILIVTNKKYGGLVREQIPELLDHQILLEPIGRNTAPCITYAAYKIKKLNPRGIMLVAPSDHAIFNEPKFISTANIALEEAAKDDKLITMGIKPHRPETGYGYIQYIHDENEVKKVKTFTEKPELSLAKKFIESGDFVWNSGMFIWSVNAIIEAIEAYIPDVAEIFHETLDSLLTEKEENAINIAYSQCKSISVDYGIMEKARNVFVIPAEFGWSDLGSWASLHEMSKKDKANNYVDANTLTFDVRNSIIKGPKDKLIVVEGLDGYLVAEHDNAILICKKDNERQFRTMFAEIKKTKGKEYL